MREKDIKKNVAVSFYFEHGVFLKDADRQNYNISLGEPLEVGSIKEDVYGFEICRSFEDIEPEKEAKTLLSLFEGLVWNHLMFFERQGIIKGKQTLSRQTEQLIEIYPELYVHPNGPLAVLYRSLIDIIGDLLHNGGKRKRKVQNALKALLEKLTEGMASYYEEVDTVIGSGVFLSNQLCAKPLELAFGISELDLGIKSKIIEEKIPVSNPFFG